MKNFKKLENLEEIKSIDLQKKSIDKYRPFSKEIENKVFQKLKLDWNFNSNAIEGNQLNYGETVAFLNFGLTAKGKPFKDHLDIKGHNEAIVFMLQLIKENRPLSESDIKDLHKIILVESYSSKTISPEGLEFQKEIKIGQYKNSPNHVKTISGDIHYYTNPEEVPFEMNKLLEWYREAEEKNVHPVVISSVFHHKFTAIHPFDDGNGRLARILSNFILLKHQYPVIVIKSKDKIEYYAALNIADNGIYENIVQLFAENIAHSFSIYQKAIEGKDINEPDDLDKEIELFTKEMQVQNIKTVDFEKDKNFLIGTYIKGFLEYFLPKLNEVGKLFQEAYLLNPDKKNSLENYKITIDEILNNSSLSKNNFKFKLFFYLKDHLVNEFDFDFDLEISLKSKTVKYDVVRYYYIEDYISNVIENETSVFSKNYFYNEPSDIVFNEVATKTIKYILNFIKNK